MTADQFFRIAFGVVFFGGFAISGYYRRKARQSESISRADEPGHIKLLRLLALPLYLSMLAYLINPAWMEWSALPLPNWLRMMGVLLGLISLGGIYWVMTSIGRNVSETYLTKESHELVMAGPYRWIRHPLYSVATLMLFSVSLIAANWFMLLMTLIAMGGIVLVVVPREEQALAVKFGEDYREYQTRTGRIAPRLRA